MGRRWASSSTTRCSTRSPSWPSPTALAAGLHQRYGDVVDRISFYAPYKSDPETWLPVLEALKSA